MATVILRPTADYNLGHTCSSGSSGYTMLSEVTADDDSTYIYQTVSTDDKSNNGVSTISYFSLSSNDDIGHFKVVKLNIYARAKTTKAKTDDTAKFYCSVRINTPNGSASTKQYTTVDLSTTYSTMNYTCTAEDVEITDKVYDSLSQLNVVVGVYTSGYKGGNKNDNFQNRVTQVYLTVEYEPVSETSGTGIYLKQNGAYKQAQTAYKKVNGVWVEQTDIAALKTELQNGRYKYGG